MDAASFAALMAPFGPFESRPVLAVAVSGGRDSLALALLAHEWAVARGGAAIGLTVDHGLRREAADEASATQALLQGQGIACEVLRWVGLKPVHGLQAAARAARYRLLFSACRRLGILHLLVAHHADDQAETVTMRAAHGSGPDGLAGMAAVVERRDARLLRPLLGVGRASLTALLRTRGLAWIDDPSNKDHRFERVRIRESGALTSEGFAEDVQRPRREAQVAEAAVATLEFDEDGAPALDRDGLLRLQEDAANSLLSRVVQAVGRLDHPPRRQRLARAGLRLALPASRGKSGKGQDFTLSGCRLMLRQEPGERRLRWIVRPENGRRDARDEGQPFFPAVFFACEASTAPHVGCQPPLTDQRP